MKPFDADEEAALRKRCAKWPESFDVPRLLATLDRERREREMILGFHDGGARATAGIAGTDGAAMTPSRMPNCASLCDFCLGTAKVPPCKACGGMGWHAP